LGRQTSLVENWDTIKAQVMLDCLRSKFNDNLYLKDKLLSTGDRYLEETNWWADRVWGVYFKDGKGCNMLGKLLMQVRDERKCK
ncbi:NADAR family protein, partial [Streptococcus pneumoniae]|uniref:NADAR family protein n=1 Tax=Streptococcus pneumoniae TaxID=1313 RepID=UPI001CBDD289